MLKMTGKDQRSLCDACKQYCMRKLLNTYINKIYLTVMMCNKLILKSVSSVNAMVMDFVRN